MFSCSLLKRFSSIGRTIQGSSILAMLGRSALHTWDTLLLVCFFGFYQMCCSLRLLQQILKKSDVPVATTRDGRNVGESGRTLGPSLQGRGS